MSPEEPHREASTAAMPRQSRLLLTPHSFSSESCQDEWVDHFKNMVLVSGWDNAAKRLWIQVRLTGRAQTAWMRLSSVDKETYARAKEALRKRFKPDSKRELYGAEFHADVKSHGVT